MGRSKRSPAPPPPDIGPVRYTQERLFYGIDDDTVKGLKAVWKEAEQLSAADLPVECLPPVIMLAAWARRQGVELVDDYDVLLQRARDAMQEWNLHHPELFFVSCVCILHQREDEPTVGAFTQVGIPEHYDNLIGI